MIHTVSKKIIIGISIITGILGFTFAKINDTVCTMEYAPVCAEVQVLCVRAPCPPIQQTFSNKCQMNANGLAIFLYEGECGNPKPDLSNCETYFDGCNDCSVVDGNLSACTMMYCETPSQPKCIKEKSIGMANPASVYCEKNGGKLEIKSNDKGQYGICNFSDGSSCEERAFFRGECKKPSPVEKYLSGYIAKNPNQFPDIQSKITFLQNLKNKFTKTYKSITSSIQDFIEMLYFNDYEKKKFTLDINGNFLSFSLHIPKSRKNKYSEHIFLDKNSSTLMLKYNKSKPYNMIFTVTAITKTDRDNLAKQPLLNTNKIIESDGYVFYYSQALDMPYTGKYAKEYGDMLGAIKDIIQTFNIIQ